MSGTRESRPQSLSTEVLQGRAECCRRAAKAFDVPESETRFFPLSQNQGLFDETDDNYYKDCTIVHEDGSVQHLRQFRNKLHWRDDDGNLVEGSVVGMYFPGDHGSDGGVVVRVQSVTEASEVTEGPLATLCTL